MARHLVKCFYCGQSFDANEVPFTMINSRRYAHKSCWEDKLASETKEEHDKRILEDYIKELFGYATIPPRVTKQIQTFVHDMEHNYTYSGIYKTLKYFFEVRGNSLEKANGGIGIVPYAYAEAYNYWKAIWEAKQRNENVDIEQFLLPTREVHIMPPKRQPMKHTRKLFTFLDDGEEEEE